MWTANLFLYRDMSVYLQEPHPKRIAGQSFSNCGLKITYIVWEWTSSLSGSVNRRINREWQRFLLSNMQGKKGSKRIEMIIKNGKWIQTHRCPICIPKPDADLWMRVDLPLDKETVENQDWLTGPRGRGAAGPRGPGAPGLLLAKPMYRQLC